MDALNQTRVTPLSSWDSLITGYCRYYFSWHSQSCVLTPLGNILIMVTIVFTPRLHTPMYFFPEQSVLYWHLPLICHCAQDAGGFAFGEEDHFLWSLHCTALLPTSVCLCWDLSAGPLMALWSLCSHLCAYYTTPMWWTWGSAYSFLSFFALWLGGTAHSLVQTFLTIRLPYCGPNIIDSYFCMFLLSSSWPAQISHRNADCVQ